MKTWNPWKIVRNLFVCAFQTGPEERDAFWSAGFRLTAWSVSLIFLGYLAYRAGAVLMGRDTGDVSALAKDAGTKIANTVLSLRGLEGLVEDVRHRFGEPG